MKTLLYDPNEARGGALDAFKFLVGTLKYWANKYKRSDFSIWLESSKEGLSLIVEIGTPPPDCPEEEIPSAVSRLKGKLKPQSYSFSISSKRDLSLQLREVAQDISTDLFDPSESMKWTGTDFDIIFIKLYKQKER